jgi:hypothetical protein
MGLTQEGMRAVELYKRILPPGHGLSAIVEIFRDCNEQQLDFPLVLTEIYLGDEKKLEGLRQVVVWTAEMLGKEVYLGDEEADFFRGVLETLGRAEDRLMDEGFEPGVIFEYVVGPRRALMEWLLNGRVTTYEKELERIYGGDEAVFGEKLDSLSIGHLLPEMGVVDITRSFGPYVYVNLTGGQRPEGRWLIDFAACYASSGFENLGWSPWRAVVDLDYQSQMRAAVVSWGGRLSNRLRLVKEAEIIDHGDLFEHGRVLDEMAVSGLEAIAETSELLKNPAVEGMAVVFDVPPEQREKILGSLIDRGLLALPREKGSISMREPLNTSFGVMKKALRIIKETFEAF